MAAIQADALAHFSFPAYAGKGRRDAQANRDGSLLFDAHSQKTA